VSGIDLLLGGLTAVHALGMIGIVLSINRLREDIVVTRILTLPEEALSDLEPRPRFARKTVVAPLVSPEEAS